MNGEIFQPVQCACMVGNIYRYLMKKITFIVAISFLVVGSYQAARARSAMVEGRIDCSSSDICYIKKMKINGDIDASTVDKVRMLVEELHKNADREKKQVHPYSLELNSLGGSVIAAFALGKILRQENIGVKVAGAFPPLAPGVCVSACVLVFAGGVHRSFNEHASKLGIHRPYLEIPQRDVPADKLREGYLQALQNVRVYLREMNVSEQLADAMFRIEPEKVRFLSEKAAIDFGLTEWDPVYKEMSDVQEAEKLGLDRHDFMGRRHRALEDCGWLAPYGEMPRDEWLRCYSGVMTNTRRAPVRPLSPAGTPDFSKYGTRADPGDWSRYPLH